MERVTRGPTTNEATAYSSNEVVNAIRKAETTAGRMSGNVIERKGRRRVAPRAQEERRDGRPHAEAPPGQGDRREHAEDDGAGARECRDDRARLEGAAEL